MLINTTGIPIVGAIWFLTALFFTDVIYIFLAKYNIKWIILFLVAAGSYADQVLTNPLPWALSAAFVGLGLYWIGNETAKNQDKLKAVLNMPLLLCIILGILEAKLILFNGYINMREGTYAFVPLFWVNATVGQDDVGSIPVEPAFLLVYAAEGNGQIFRIATLGSAVQILADGKQFMADNSQRESARWQEALDMLIMWGWVKSVGRKGEVYEVTGTGYTKADWLKDGMCIDTSKEPLEELKQFEV